MIEELSRWIGTQAPVHFFRGIVGPDRQTSADRFNDYARLIDNSSRTALEMRKIIESLSRIKKTDALTWAK